MICPDINLLLYATNEAVPQHAKAKAWWDEALSGVEPVGLIHVVVLGFIRLATNRKVFTHPLRVEEVTRLVDSWLAQPNVRFVVPSESHWGIFKSMLEDGYAAANLTTDAHIAAMAFEYGMVVHTNDADFDRFPNVTTCNPLQ